MKKNLLWALFIGNLVIICAFWWFGSNTYITGGSGVAGELIAFGRLAGLLAEYLILVQLVLVGRIRPVERLYGFDRLNYLHRTLGFYILGLVLFHPVALSFGYSALGAGGAFSISGAAGQFLIFLKTWNDVFKAFLGLLLLVTVVGISMAIIRKKLRYETWYFIHLLVYVAIALVFSHQLNTADVSTGIALYYWLLLNFLIFGLVLVYRFIRPLWLFNKHRFRIEKIVQETPTVYSVYITGRNIEQFQFDAGQFANLTFLVKNMWYSHPFSFSATHNGRYIRFSIKGVGDFSNEVPRLAPGTKVIIDGPYGTFTEAHAKSADPNTGAPAKFLFIAGGIGITPIRAMAEDAHETGNDALILYGTRTAEEIAFKKEFASMSLPLIPFISELIDQAAISRCVPDVRERDVYVCGPVPMMKKVIAALTALGVPARHIHYEIFAY
jgi:predicted ferric reductase